MLTFLLARRTQHTPNDSIIASLVHFQACFKPGGTQYLYNPCLVNSGTNDLSANVMRLARSTPEDAESAISMSSLDTRSCYLRFAHDEQLNFSMTDRAPAPLLSRRDWSRQPLPYQLAEYWVLRFPCQGPCRRQDSPLARSCRTSSSTERPSFCDVHRPTYRCGLALLKFQCLLPSSPCLICQHMHSHLSFHEPMVAPLYPLRCCSISSAMFSYSKW